MSLKKEPEIVKGKSTNVEISKHSLSPIVSAYFRGKEWMRERGLIYYIITNRWNRCHSDDTPPVICSYIGLQARGKPATQKEPNNTQNIHPNIKPRSGLRYGGWLFYAIASSVESKLNLFSAVKPIP